MGRRGGTVRFVCSAKACTESAFYEYDTLRERADLVSRYDGKWTCIRHKNPERNLRPDNTAVQAVLICTAMRRDDGTVYGLTWRPEGGGSGSGFNHSAAHTAYAEDFPEGTRLVVTAYVETPEQAAIAAEVERES